MKKRLLILLLIALFIVEMIPAAVSAATSGDYFATLEIPIHKHVDLVGSELPGRASFELEVFGLGAKSSYDILKNEVRTNGIGNFEGSIVIGIPTENDFRNLSEGILIREKDTGLSGWIYDTSEWVVLPYMGTFLVGNKTVELPTVAIYCTSAGEAPDYAGHVSRHTGIELLNYYVKPSDYYMILDIPIYKYVESTDGSDPGQQTFAVEISAFHAKVDVDILENTVTVPGLGGFYEGNLKIGIKTEDDFWGLTEGFEVREVKDNRKNWSFDGTEWYIVPYLANVYIDGRLAQRIAFSVYNKTAGEEIEYGSHTTRYTGVSFINTYTPDPGNCIITYDPTGGTVTYPQLAFPKGSTVGLTQMAFREGYTFIGWYNEPEATTPLTTIQLDSNRTVYAGWVRTDVPLLLNGDTHNYYVEGYPDGTVRPLNNITRAEVTMIFYRLLKPVVRDAYHSTTNSFGDVKSTDWFNEAVSTMAKIGIINGRSDTVFAPNAPITRAEYATICARFDTTFISEYTFFTDIDSHWAKQYIMRAATLGWIQGYSDHTFKPNQFITRAESITLTNRVLQRLPGSVNDLLPGMTMFSDNLDSSKWYYLMIQEATNSHEYKKKDNGYETWTALK